MLGVVKNDLDGVPTFKNPDQISSLMTSDNIILCSNILYMIITCARASREAPVTRSVLSASLARGFELYCIVYEARVGKDHVCIRHRANLFVHCSIVYFMYLGRFVHVTRPMTASPVSLDRKPLSSSLLMACVGSNDDMSDRTSAITDRAVRRSVNRHEGNPVRYAKTVV